MAGFKAIDRGTTTLAPATSAQADVPVEGYNVLYVLARIGNAATPATAAGDLSLAITPIEDDIATQFPSPVSGPVALVPDLTTRTASLTTNVAYIAQRFIISGLTTVRVYVTNSNVGALQGATAIVFRK